MYNYRSDLKNKSRMLRKNMTEAEVKLWLAVRKKQIAGLQFYRQKPLGTYIVDFYCPNKRLVIEIDGGQHYENIGMKKDEIRDKYLVGDLKLKILRFTNIDVLKNIEGVIARIMEETE